MVRHIAKNNYAFIVGIGKRKEDDDHMKVTVDDAKCLAKNLQIYCGFKADNIKLLVGKKNTSDKRILKNLENFIRQTNSNAQADLTIIYFSGHGIIFKNEYYFICNNTKESTFPKNAILSKHLLERLKIINTKKLLLLFDSCNSSGINIDGARNGTILHKNPELTKFIDRAIITSSSDKEHSYTSKPLSLFTIALIRGLAGESLHKEEKTVTLFQLAMYIRESVQNYSLRKQNPELDVLESSRTSNFEIVNHPNGKPKQKPFKKSVLLKIRDSTGRKVFHKIKPNSTDIEYRLKFDYLLDRISKRIYPRVHFMPIKSMINTLPNKHIIKNKLTFFTKREKTDIKILVKHLQKSRRACLLGYPATGKSFSVIEISKQIVKKGLIPFYISMKSQTNNWDTVIEELARNQTGNVYIIDDIHLNHSVAFKIYSLLDRGEFSDLRVLFVSRYYSPLKSEANLISVLKPWTIEMEQPSIEAKINGIVRKNSKEFKKRHGQKYKIGNLKHIIAKTHRNLIYLNEYIKYGSINQNKNYPKSLSLSYIKRYTTITF